MKRIVVFSILASLGLCGKSFNRKIDTKKMPYEGLGKKSKANGLIKAKGTSGYWKGNPKKGYKFVNAYSRSK